MTSVVHLTLVGPGGEPVDLRRTVNSHGFADLAPTRLDEESDTLEVTLPTPGRPRRVRIAPGRSGGAAVEILGGREPGRRTREAIVAGVRHVLRLDQDLSGFYAACAGDPELSWVGLGAGRMLRSPTVFEDVVKTVCTTNCAWGATVRMVEALVTHLGEPAVGGEGPLSNAFPSAARMAEAPESFYRDTVRAGYRGAYLRSLSGSVAAGDLELEALGAMDTGELPDQELEELLLALPGVGPYAAAHIMMTIGRHSRLILDSWTRPTYARLRGKRAVSDEAIRRRFHRFGDFAGLAFWLYLTRDWVEEG